MNVKRLLILAAVSVLTLSGLSSLGSVTAQDGNATAWLGVGIRDIDNGVEIAAVTPDSPAEDAGLKAGDVIKTVDTTTIASGEMLVDIIQGYAPGDEITLTVARDGEEFEIAVTLAERPTEVAVPPMPSTTHPGLHGVLNLMGLEGSLTEDGLLIETVEADSAWAEAGVQEGDIVTAINGESLTDTMMPGTMHLFRFGEDLTLTVIRDGEELEITVTLPEVVGGGPFMFDEMPYEVMPDTMPMFSQPPTQLGVEYLTLTAKLAEDENLPVSEGAWIRQVFEDTPAAKAGLLEGDIIVSVDGDSVDEEHTLADRLHAYEAGDVVTFAVLRDGDEIEIEAELGPRGSFVISGGMMPGFDMNRGPGGRQQGRGSFMMPGQGFEFGPGMRFYNFDEMPNFNEFMDAHPFMGRMFGHMFGDGGYYFQGPGGMFQFGPEGFEFHFGPDAPNIPDTDAAPDAPETDTAPAGEGGAA